MKELAPGISAVLGIKEGHSEIQALRFEKTKHTFNEAKKWATEHNYKPILEEEASGEAKKDSVDRIDGGGRLE